MAAISLADARHRIVPFVANFSSVNPHASITLKYEAEVGGFETTFPATDVSWKRWLPFDPTSPHWYDVPRPSRLIGANIARAADRNEPSMTVRDFVGEFRGLARTQIRAAVCDAIGASRLSLAQFFGNGTDLRRTGKLLDEMKRYSTPVQPKLLGAIGHAHLYAHIMAAGAAKETIEYKSAAFSHGGIPYLVEAAFGYCPKGHEERSFVKRKIITGINNSVAIGDPFRDISDAESEYAQSLGEILTDLKAGQQEPIIFVLHVVSPAPAPFARDR